LPRMEIVDTNVIIRYLMADIGELYSQAETLFTEAIKGEKKLFIPQSVIAEVVFVLSKVYKIPRKEIASAISYFLNIKNCKIQDSKVVKVALDIYRKSNLSFVDSLICAYAKLNNFNLVTFDLELKKKCRDLQEVIP